MGLEIGIGGHRGSGVYDGPDERAAGGRAHAPAEPMECRVRALFDRARPRRPADLDLADAVLRLHFPEYWSAYRGAFDLGQVARALDSVPVEREDLSWIASPAFARGLRPA